MADYYCGWPLEFYERKVEFLDVEVSKPPDTRKFRLSDWGELDKFGIKAIVNISVAVTLVLSLTVAFELIRRKRMR